MICPTELELSVYADGAATADTTAAIEAHLAMCPTCPGRLATLRAEAGLVAAALTEEDELIRVPAFQRPSSRGAFAAAATCFVLAAALVTAAPALLDFSVPAPLTWFDPFDVGTLVDLAVRAAIFLVPRGGAIMTSLVETAAAAAIIGFVVWIAVSLRKRRGPLMLSVLACAVVSLPAPVQALDIRRADNGSVLIRADETIQDTLIALGETVEVNGDVEGDLIAFGRRVIVRGRVGGLVLTGAQNVTIEGEVGGSLIGFAQSLNVASRRIGGNLFGFGATIEPVQNVEGNAVVFAERTNLTGAIGRDVFGFAEQIEVGSTVGGSLTAFANRLNLLATARITANLTAHLPDEDRLTVSPGAVIGGEVETRIRERHDERSEYTSAGYYVAQALRYAAAFLTGLVLLALVPRLRQASLNDMPQALVAGGVGVVTLVAVPIIAVLVAITIIGIPIAVLAVLLWLAAIYLAKIVLAHGIGARILDASSSTRHFAVALALGLVLVLLAVEVPFIGGLLNFLLTICGLGLLVLFAWRAVRRDPEPLR
jgi:anti-sigma factor RsiW